MQSSGYRKTGSLEQYATRWFSDRNVEANFVNGRAEGVTVQPGSPVTFDRHSVELLGLVDLGAPEFENRHVIRWVDEAGLAKAAALAGRGTQSHHHTALASRLS